jgi:hypothetical protein
MRGAFPEAIAFITPASDGVVAYGDGGADLLIRVENAELPLLERGQAV